MNKLAAVFVALCLALFFNSSFILAQTPAENEQKLLEIQKQITDLEGQVNKLQEQEKTLNSQLKVIDAQTQITKLKIEETSTQIKRLEQEITDLSERIDKLSTTVESISGVLLTRIIQTYKHGGFSNLDLLLSSHGFSDLLIRSKYLQVAQANDKKVLYQLQATKATYNDQRTDRQTRQTDMEKLKKNLENQQNQLSLQKQAKEDLLKVTQNDETKYQALLSQLRADADSIRRTLGGTGIKRGPVKRGEIIASVGNSGCSTGAHLHFEVMTNAKVENNTVVGKENKVDPKTYIDSGQFDKPLAIYTGNQCGDTCNQGDISALFGASGADYIKGFPPHTGLDIAAPKGTPIHAASDGIAYEFSDSRACYLTGTVGRGVAIDHQNGLVTLYWHI